MREMSKNHAALVEGFLPDFYARGKFMKYSMSGCGVSGQCKKSLGVRKAMLAQNLKERFRKH